MKNGIILQKLQALDETLMEIRSLGRIDIAQLTNEWRTRRAVERDLQVLVEIVIDICQRAISLAGQSPATSAVDAVDRCVQLGVLSSSDPYRQAVRFRNIVVHRYDRIKVDILVDVVNNHLRDFERFRDEVLAYAHREP